MAIKKTHQKNLKRAKIRCQKGLDSHRIEQRKKIDVAWRNIFVKAGILEAK